MILCCCFRFLSFSFFPSFGTKELNLCFFEKESTWFWVVGVDVCKQRKTTGRLWSALGMRPRNRCCFTFLDFILLGVQFWSELMKLAFRTQTHRHTHTHTYTHKLLAARICVFGLTFVCCFQLPPDALTWMSPASNHLLYEHKVVPQSVGVVEIGFCRLSSIMDHLAGSVICGQHLANGF